MIAHTFLRLTGNKFFHLEKNSWSKEISNSFKFLEVKISERAGIVFSIPGSPTIVLSRILIGVLGSYAIPVNSNMGLR